MTTNRILQLLPIAAMCLPFTSCIDSKVPLSAPNKSKADERLAGGWRQRCESGEVNDYRFAPAGGKLPASVMRLTGSMGKIEQDEQGNTKVYFTDTTENLVKFVVEAGDDLFSKDTVRLERVK